jgi:hypothetical protein
LKFNAYPELDQSEEEGNGGEDGEGGEEGLDGSNGEEEDDSSDAGDATDTPAPATGGGTSSLFILSPNSSRGSYGYDEASFPRLH